MSKKNRKLVYDKLVEAGKFANISEPLKVEFGDPQATEEVKPEPKPKPKKKAVRKRWG